MNEKPLTATMIAEANREYWSRPDVIARERHLNEMITAAYETLYRRVTDIIYKRVKDGWPTRDACGARDEEDC